MVSVVCINTQFYSGLNFKCNKLIGGSTEDRLNTVLTLITETSFKFKHSELLDILCRQILSCKKTATKTAIASKYCDGEHCYNSSTQASEAG